jgi:hypothetical protein
LLLRFPADKHLQEPEKRRCPRGAFELLAIFLQGARVARQVVRAVKLHWVNEDTDHHDICTGFRFVDQLHMAVMQVAHGGDQCDTFTFLTRATDMLAKQRQGFND